MIRHVLVILSTLVFMTACGGSGGYGGGSAGGATGTGLSGGGTKGPLAGAVVTVYAVDYSAADLKGAAVATGTTNAAAKITGVTLPFPVAAPYILEFTSDAGTTDITTGQAPVIGTLRTVITDALINGGEQIYATPLTTMATDIAAATSPADEAALEAALSAAADQVVSTVGFGMPGDIDIFDTPPLIDNTTVTDEEQTNVAAYRAAIEALTAVAFQINESGTTDSTEDVLAALTDDLADGSIDGVGSTGPTGIESANINEAFAEDPASLIIPNTTKAVGDIEQELASETTSTGETTSTTNLQNGNIQTNEQPAQTNPDRDSDGRPNAKDAFPDDATEQDDNDKDGIGDVADDDDDNDGVPDTSDDFPFDPTRSNSADVDADGDGFFGAADAFPNDSTEWADFDGDLTGDNADTDDDNDGTPDSADAFPKNAAQQIDTDRDGLGNNDINSNPSVPGGDLDDDNDGISDVNEGIDATPGNSVDNTSDPLLRDTDGDGKGDKTDKFPNDPSQQTDTDNDGLGNNDQNSTPPVSGGDLDDDNDGRPDTDEGSTCNATSVPPLSKRLVADSDGDGLSDGVEVNGNPANNNKTSNPCLSDTDNDGEPDPTDLFPNNAGESDDSDEDGVGDNTDNCPTIANSDQSDTNNNGKGDVCDATPTANAQTIAPTEDTTFNGTLTGSDPEGDSLTFTIVANGTKGTAAVVDASAGTFTYTPTADANGADSFTFTVNDGTSTSAEATVTVNIANVNDAPTANAQTIEPTEDTVFNDTLTGSDPEGDSLTFAIVANGTKGAATITDANAGTFAYTPNADENGADSFTFTVNDGSSTSAEATVTVNIGAINDTPVADNASATTAQDTQLTGTVTASDVDGDSLTFAQVGSAVNGSATVNSDGSYTFDPTPSFIGEASFQFKANDATVDSNTATVTVTVSNNQPPTANPQTIAPTEDTVFNGTLTSSDPENDQVTYAIAQQGTKGTAAVIGANDGTFTYTPNADANGADTFTFTVNDGTSTSAAATVTVNIAATNDAPVPQDQSVNTNEDSAISGTVTVIDPDGPPSSFDLVAPFPQNGTVTAFDGSTGEFTYTPNADFNGQDSFGFHAFDGVDDSTTDGVVTINIAPVNDAPLISGTPTTSGTDGQAYSFTPTVDDIDEPADTLTFAIVNKPSWATFSTTTGELSGTAATGTYADIQISVDDGAGGSDSLPAFTITVSAAGNPTMEWGTGTWGNSNWGGAP